MRDEMLRECQHQFTKSRATSVGPSSMEWFHRMNFLRDAWWMTENRCNVRWSCSERRRTMFEAGPSGLETSESVQRTDCRPTTLKWASPSLQLTTAVFQRVDWRTTPCGSESEQTLCAELATRKTNRFSRLRKSSINDDNVPLSKFDCNCLRETNQTGATQKATIQIHHCWKLSNLWRNRSRKTIRLQSPEKCKDQHALRRDAIAQVSERW